MILAGEMTLEPDYSWVPEGLSNFVGGLLSAALLILPIVLAIGLIAWLWTLVTGPRWDNAVGETRIATVLLCIILVGTLAGGVGWGMKTIGTTTVDTNVTSLGASQTYLEKAQSKAQDAVEKLKRGNLIGAAGSALGAAGELANAGIDAIGDSAKKAADATKGFFDKAGTAIRNGIDTIGNAIGNAGSWLRDHLPLIPRV